MQALPSNGPRLYLCFFSSSLFVLLSLPAAPVVVVSGNRHPPPSPGSPPYLVFDPFKIRSVRSTCCNGSWKWAGGLVRPFPPVHLLTSRQAYYYARGKFSGKRGGSRPLWRAGFFYYRCIRTPDANNSLARLESFVVRPSSLGRKVKRFGRQRCLQLSKRARRALLKAGSSRRG